MDDKGIEDVLSSIRRLVSDENDTQDRTKDEGAPTKSPLTLGVSQRVRSRPLAIEPSSGPEKVAFDKPIFATSKASRRLSRRGRDHSTAVTRVVSEPMLTLRNPLSVPGPQGAGDGPSPYGGSRHGGTPDPLILKPAEGQPPATDANANAAQSTDQPAPPDEPVTPNRDAPLVLTTADAPPVLATPDAPLVLTTADASPTPPPSHEADTTSASTTNASTTNDIATSSSTASAPNEGAALGAAPATSPPIDASTLATTPATTPASTPATNAFDAPLVVHPATDQTPADKPTEAAEAAVIPKTLETAEVLETKINALEAAVSSMAMKAVDRVLETTSNPATPPIDGQAATADAPSDASPAQRDATENDTAAADNHAGSHADNQMGDKNRSKSDPESVANLFKLEEPRLRHLLRDILREELEGDLGERITRNIRMMIKSEVSRALSEKG
jgi:hypothetical protein